jgi:hypothetical protein
MNERRPWQPRVDEDQILNPFAPPTQPSQPVDEEHIELDDDGEESEGETPPAAE